MERLAYSIDDLVKGGIARRSKIYKIIDEGLLRAVKHGRLTRILPADLDRYLKSLPAIEPKAETPEPKADEQQPVRRARRIRGRRP